MAHFSFLSRLQARRRPIRKTLQVEALEHRIVPNAVSWIGPSSGAWDDSANWLDATTSTNRVPNSADDVTIDVAGAITVTIDDVRAVNTLQCVNDLVVASGGNLETAAASEIDGNLTLVGDLTAFGAMNLAGATSWSLGTIAGSSVKNTGTLTMTGTADKSIVGTFENQGTLVQAGAGNLVLNNSSTTLNNDAAGVIDFQSDGGINSFNSVFNNSGLIKKSSGTGTSRIGGATGSGMYFNQLGGTLDAQSGTLQFDQTRTSLPETGGTWNAQTGAILDFVGEGQSGTYLAGTFTGSGAGTVQLGSGYFGIDADEATFNFPAGLLHWNSGEFFGHAITNAGSITISGSGSPKLSTVLNNDGSIIEVGSGNLVIGGTLNNNATGIIDLQSDVGISGAGAVNNAGTFRKTAGTGNSVLGASLYFNNTGGVIDVQSGALTLAGGGFSKGGTFLASTGAVLELAGSHAFTGTYTGSGGGQVNLDGSLSPVDGGVAGASMVLNFPEGFFHWTAGEIEGGGSASVIGSNVPLTNAGFITIDGAATKYLRRNTIINLGTIIDAGPGDFLLHGNGDFATSTIDNRAGATFDFQGDALIDELPGNKGTFINAGTVVKSGGSGLSEIGGYFNSVPSGLIEVETGRLALGYGGTWTGSSFNIASGAVLEFGLSTAYFNMTGTYTGTGNGTIDFKGGLNGGDDSNPAILDFAPGYFHMSGAWAGAVQNDGYITLDGNFARAHIINNGTITQTGPHDFQLNANTYFENRGLYDIQTDASIVVPGDASGGNMQFVNTGVLRKSAGTGTSQLKHDGSGKAFYLNNTGTVEALSGTLAILDQPAQVTGTTLSAGAWNAKNGATLAFPDGDTITSNQGSLTLDGAGATIAAIAPLATNQGSFTVANGADFATAGSLANPGTLAIGPSSILTINGDLTTAPTSALAIGIAGSPGSGAFGQLAVTGQANLQGQLVVQPAAGFGPTQGDVYTVATYASNDGDFAAVGGLPPFFTENTGPTSIQLNVISSAANIATQSIVLPADSNVGVNATVQYTIANSTTVPINGDWTDSVYLSRSASFGPDAVLFARVPHTGGLGALGNYTGVASGSIPNLVDGDYHVIVVADSSIHVPDTNRVDNTLISTNTFHIEVPALTLNTGFNDTIQFGQSKLYRIEVPPGSGDLVLDYSQAAAHEANVFVAFASLPGEGNADAAFTNQDGQTAHLLIPHAFGGSYYVLVQGREGAATPQPFTLTPRLAGFEIRNVAPNHGSNAGQTTVAITGSGFTPDSTVSLADGGTSIPAASTTFQDSQHLFATFDLTGHTIGNYDVQVATGAATTTDAAAFTVEAGAGGSFFYTLTLPSTMRVGSTAQAIIDYSNTGDTDIPAPILLITSDNALVKLDSQTDYGDGQLEVLAINNSGPAGILPPGAHGRILVDFVQVNSGSHVSSSIHVSSVDPQNALDWTLLKDTLKPPTMQTDAWDAIWQNVIADFGTTYSQYQQIMDETASYLSQLGEYTSDIARLLSFRIRIADNFGAITGRYALGPFGRGQADNLNIMASADSDGTVSIASAGEVRAFFPQTSGGYVGLSGDAGVLSKLPNGGYRLQEVDGSAKIFDPSGKISYSQDGNGNRITWNYSGSRVTSLAYSNGDITTFTYNPQGRITQVTDPVGRITTYTYDNGGTGEHVAQISDAAGITSISYVTGQGDQREHAVSSITFPDGSQKNYQYDSRGRLILTTINGGLNPVAYSYDNIGGITIVDASNNATHILRDDSDSMSQLTDPTGSVYTASFDDNGLLSNLIQPGGLPLKLGRNSKGQASSMTDPLGQAVGFNYEANDTQVSGITGANGNQTAYGHDANGNLISETNATGSPIQFERDTRGNVVQKTLPSGKGEVDAYDSHGLLIHRSLSDGQEIDYAYDLHRELQSITDGSGTTTFQHDAADRLTHVSDPSGRAIDYQYDSFGRLSQLKTSDNYELNYSYDAAGRLNRVSDSNDATIATYDYNDVGLLSSEEFGNGTSTSYTYDAFGHALSVISRAADHSVLSEQDYTYDALGRTRTMATADGTTTYDYDEIGQLIGVSLPGGRTITYTYDKAGNRISSSDTGTSQTINYSSNSFDQYLTAGTASFTYDADGNLATRTDSSGTTTYSYDAQNQLIGASGPVGTFSYEYDALGNRSAVVHDGVRVEYLVSPLGNGDVIGEYDAGGGLIAHYAQGAGLVGRTNSSGDTSYYQFDATGNVVGLSNPAGTATVDTYSYLPFGGMLASSVSTPNPFTYVGKAGVMDSGDGLYYMRNRFYDPSIGRFTQPDPIGLKGGDANVFRYGGNNPVGRSDPRGTSPALITGAVGVALGLVDAATLNPFGATTGKLFSNITRLNTAIDGVVASLGGDAVVVSGSAAAPWVAPCAMGPTVVEQIIARRAAAAAATAAFGSGAAIVLTGALVIPAIQRATDEVRYHPYVQPVLNFTDEDYVRHVRNSKNNHPLLDAVARDIARENHHSEPTAQDYIDANIAIRTAQKNGTIDGRTPGDPNDMTGPAGVGAQNFIQPGGTFPYRIDFENILDASAPAQVVKVTQQLDPSLDWTTFQLGDFGIGGQTFSIPPGLTSYSTRIDARATVGVYVDVSVSFDTLTGQLAWTFSSVDPSTGDLPADVLAGFLPPNVVDPEGDAFLSYRVQPKAGLASGTVVPAKGTVIFDAGLSDESSLDTPTFSNTIDSAPPTSSVDALPAVTSGPNIPVSWSGSDAESGIATYSAFVSIDGGAYTPWLSNTSSTLGTYSGAVGHTYSFYTIATDNVGLSQPSAGTAQTTRTIPSPTLIGFRQFAAGSDGGSSTVAEYNPDGTAANTFNPFPGTTGGVRTAVGMFNGAGLADVAVGTGPGARAEVKILDGDTGEVIFDVFPFENFTGGVFVAAGDITGDGIADLVITPDLAGGPRVEIYRGGDFTEIANFFGIDDPNFRGGARASLGDLNGDGNADLVISAGFGGGPRISLYDGAALGAGTQTHLAPDFFLFEQTLRNGAYVAVGDLDGDGAADIIGGGGPGGGPRVLVISGETLLSKGTTAAFAAPIANFFAGDTNNRGGIRVSAKNLDDDFNADIVVGAGSGAGSRVTAYLGKNLVVGDATEDLAFDAFPGFSGGVYVG